MMDVLEAREVISDMKNRYEPKTLEVEVDDLARYEAAADLLRGIGNGVIHNPKLYQHLIDEADLMDGKGDTEEADRLRGAAKAYALRDVRTITHTWTPPDPNAVTEGYDEESATRFKSACLDELEAIIAECDT